VASGATVAAIRADSGDAQQVVMAVDDAVSRLGGLSGAPHYRRSAGRW
jgi:hypothetical protein